MSSCFVIATPGRDNAAHRQMMSVARALVGRGHEVVVLVDGHRATARLESPGITAAAWPSLRPTKWRDAVFLARVIKARRPSAIIATFGAVNVSMLVGWLLRVPVRVAWQRTLSRAVTFDATNRIPLFFLRLRKRLVFRFATHLVANSRAGVEDLERIFRVARRKSSVLPNGIIDPLGRIGPPPDGHDPRKVLCAGRLYPTKGQDVLLRALPSILEEFPDLLCDFIGDGPSKENLLDLAAELGVLKACEFKGLRANDDVLRAMSSSVATIVPSRSESFGWVNIESMAMGTPVVASAVGGIVDVVEDGKSGFLVEPDDPAMLADKILAILQNPALRDELSRGARATFLERYDLTALASDQAEWLEQLTSDRVAFP